MLFCGNCGAEVEKSFRFCEKCFQRLDETGIVESKINTHITKIMSGNEKGKDSFPTELLSERLDLSGCCTDKFRLISRECINDGREYYSAADIADGTRNMIMYFRITEMDDADRFELMSGEKSSKIALKAREICIAESERFKAIQRKTMNDYAFKGIECFMPDDESACHFIVDIGKVKPLFMEIRNGRIDIRRIIKIAADVCKQLDEFERNGIKYNSISEKNIFIAEDGQAVLGAEFGRKLRDEFIGGESDIYLPPDYASGDNSSVYSLAVMLYRMFNGGRMPYVNYFTEKVNYADFKRAEHQRSIFAELQLPANAGNMLGNMISGIISDPDWRNVCVTEVLKTLENSLDYLSSEELSRKI